MTEVLETPREVYFGTEKGEYDLNHDIFVAQQAWNHGYPIAGGIREIYEDAVVMIPPAFAFEWNKRPAIMGRVLWFRHEYELYTVVIQIHDGSQVRYTGHQNNTCYFALPEDSEKAFRK